MANGLAGGIERGLGGLAAGIKAKRKFANEEEARQLAARFLAQYQKSGGQLPQDGGGLGTLMGVDQGLGYLQAFTPPVAKPEAMPGTVDPGDYVRDAGAEGGYRQIGVPTQSRGSMGTPSLLTKMLSERAALSPDDPNVATYDDAIQKYSQGVQTFTPTATATGEIVPFATRTGQFAQPSGQFKPATAEVKTQKVSLEDAILNARKVRGLFDEALVGPLAGNVGKIKMTFANSPEFAKLRSATGRLRAIIYGLSGKQINEQEQEWLNKEILPRLTNPDENFQFYLDSFEEWADQRLGLVSDEFKIPKNKKLDEVDEKGRKRVEQKKSKFQIEAID